MDLPIVAGLLLAVALLSWSLSLGGAGAGAFVRAPSALALGGGARELREVLARGLRARAESPRQAIERIADHAEVACRDGWLALDQRLSGERESLFARGVRLAIDGFSAQALRDLLELEAAAQEQRLATGRRLLVRFGATAAALGVVVALVALGGDLAKPGAASAAASAPLAALYGAATACLVCLPLANRVDSRAREEALLREIEIEGALALQSGERPGAIRAALERELVARLGTEA